MKRLAFFLLFFFVCVDAQAASRFWVGGTGTWDSSDTTHWAASSGGAGGQSVPGSSDSVTFDGSSGGGTVTLNFGGTISIQSLTMGAFTGTWDNSVNNNNFTLSTAVFAMNIGGFGQTWTMKLGTATYTLTAAGAQITSGNCAGCSFQASSSTIAYTGGAGIKRLSPGAFTYGTISIPAISAGGDFEITSGGTIGNLTINAPSSIRLGGSQTVTISNAQTWAGTSTAPIYFASDVMGTNTNLALASGTTCNWCAIRDVTATTGSPVANNSFDLGHNVNWTINAPGGGGSCIISGWLLYRDLDPAANDNFAAFLEKAG